ncbi:MAG: NAD(P)H-dependent oxidoreductase [Saprospiraceae bacterium]|nr:NAD(P)H-dependent oxidoreductase [Saprospiraceae bacterium]
MITIISGTNRKDSRTRILAEFVHSVCQTKAWESQILYLDEVPLSALDNPSYSTEGQHDLLGEIQDKYLVNTKKWYIISPEYNGSYAGFFKFFLDACSIRSYKETFKGGKKAALLGVASGRSGNLRGMEHLTGALNYLGINVMPNHQPISSIDSLVNKTEIIDEETKKTIKDHIISFLHF